MTTTTTPAPGSILEAALRATCDARTGEQAGDYGFTPLWCHQTRGLRRYIDTSGVERRFCANHEAAVRRRYPEAEEPESADGLTASKVLAEIARMA